MIVTLNNEMVDGGRGALRGAAKIKEGTWDGLD